MDHKDRVAELSAGPRVHLRSCWQSHLGRGQRDFNPRSKHDTLGEAKGLCCLELPKISDPRGRRRPVKGSIQGVWEKANVPWIGRHYYICQEDLLGADATYSSFPWAGGHCVTGATKPHRHTGLCVSPTVLPSLLKQAGVSQSKNLPAAWKIKTKFTSLIKNKHKRHLAMLALSCI